jgi:hypothetical protein
MTLIRLTRFGTTHYFKEPIWVHWDGSKEDPYMVCTVEVDRLEELEEVGEEVYVGECDGDLFTMHEDEPDEYHVAVARQALLGSETNDETKG